MTRQLDVLFVNYSEQSVTYQLLAQRWTAIEPPVWSLILAHAIRKFGFGTAILDCDALGLSLKESLEQIKSHNARLNVFVSMGQQPNSSTLSMHGNTKLAERLKSEYPTSLICFYGTHTQALPEEVLAYPFCDFVLPNEGIKPLISLLGTDLKTELSKVKGIGYKVSNTMQHLTDANQTIVPQSEMDQYMGYALDLLPYKNQPLDLYRSHIWLADFKDEDRVPYFAPYSSFGCFAQCSYCIINSLNREDVTSDNYHAGKSNIMRYWSPELVCNELEKLAKLGVKTMFWKDEMMVYNKRHFMPLFNMMIERFGNHFSQFVYSRINTIKEDYLELLSNVGVKWIGFGIESANQKIRQEVTKGHFKDIDIREILSKVKQSGISSINNFIYGLADESEETARQTTELAIELEGEFTNLYVAMPLPGSYDYIRAKEEKLDMPKEFSEWAFYSEDCKPLPTKYLSSADIIRIRDDAWHKIHTNPSYLRLAEEKFGMKARQNIEEMSKIKLRRKLLES